MRLVINADDLGYEPEVSRGILTALREGVVSSATLMVTSPFAEAAAREATGLSVGLHVTLVRFPWLTGGRGALVDEEVGAIPPGEVAAEVEAQVGRCTALLGRAPTHLDVHRHLHRLPSVLDAVAAVARARGLPVRSVDEGMRAALRAAGVSTNDVFLGEAGAQAYWTPERLEAALDALPTDGLVELMCHPGYRPEALSSGYAAQREVELATFTSPRARAALESRGLQPGGWPRVGTDRG